MTVCILCNHQERSVTEHDLVLDAEGSDRENLTVPLCEICAVELRTLDWTELTDVDSASN